jgi:mitogen-activated protein kinase 15
MFPGENTTDQIHKILAYSGYPSEEDIKSLNSSVVKPMLKESKAPNCPANIKSLLKDLPPLFTDLVQKMTIFNPK